MYSGICDGNFRGDHNDDGVDDENDLDLIRVTETTTKKSTINDVDLSVVAARSLADPL